MQSFNINFAVPSKWSELSDKQLRYVYQLITDGNDAAVCESATLRNYAIFKNITERGWLRYGLFGRR